MMNNTPSGAKKHCKSTEPESCQTAKMFFFFFFFFFFFRWASWNLHDSLTMVFTQNRRIFTEQCISPSLFSRFEVTRGISNHSPKNYGFLCDAIFLHMYTCIQVVDTHTRVQIKTNKNGTKQLSTVTNEHYNTNRAEIEYSTNQEIKRVIKLYEDTKVHSYM